MHQVIVYISDIYHDNVHCVSEERQSVMQSGASSTMRLLSCLQPTTRGQTIGDTDHQTIQTAVRQSVAALPAAKTAVTVMERNSY